MLASRVSDWDEWLQEARREHLSGVIWTSCCDAGVEHMLPEAVSSQLRSEWRQSVSSGALIHQPVVEIARTLDAGRIAWVLLKSPSVEDILYPSSGSGPTAGIVILVKPADFREALKHLHADGWEPSGSTASAHLEISYAVLHKDSPSASSVCVQWNLFGDMPLPGEEIVWDHLEKEEIGGLSVAVLSAADQAIYAALRAVLMHKLQPAAELLCVVQSFSRLDHRSWETLAEDACKLNVVEEVYRALVAARARADFAVPEHIWRLLLHSRPRGLRRRAASLALSDSGNAGAFLARLIIMDGAQHKANYVQHALFSPRQQQSGAASTGRAHPLGGLCRALRCLLMAPGA